MAYHTYRYQWNGTTNEYINQRIDPALPASITGFGPLIEIDISADDTTKNDLDQAMAQQGWIFVATDPVGPLP